VVELEGTGRDVNPEVRRYLNRLSDLLFVVARSVAGDGDVPSRAP
jgi:cob(I)alamin adenosyltransferase